LLVQILLFAAAVRHQQLVSEEQLHQVVAGAGSWTRGHHIPEGFYESAEHWAQVVNLVDQTLDLRRLIFLERVEDDHRVHEIKSLRCNINDIDERRRDFERRPYSTAIEEGGPLLLTKPYLKSPGEDAEVEYLVPLVFAGDVVGFWAFGIDPERLEQRDEFEQMVQTFANQIAELLYHRQQREHEVRTESRALNRYLRLEGGGEMRRRVGYALKSIEQRHSLLDRVLGGLDTAIVVYDLFGRILTVNSAMEAMAGDHQLPIYDMTALDLLTRLTDMDPRQARQVLNYLTLQSKSRRIPVMLDENQSQNYLLMMKPLGRDSASNVNSEATAFDISGLLFEIIDVSAISALCGMKESLVQRYIWDMRNDLESIQMGTDLLQSEKTGSDQRQRVSSIVQEKLQALALKLSSVEKDIKTSVQTIDREGYPLDTMSRLETILRDIDAAATEHGIRFVVDMPSFFTLVLAQPAEFDRLVHSILTILLNDAAVDTEIRIRVWLEEDKVRYQFTNTGFGLPDDDLQRFLRATGHAVSEDFRVLHDCITALQCWGGGLEASSAVGKGFRFEFSLPTAV
jgi:signal transduction histidine kinase